MWSLGRIVHRLIYGRVPGDNMHDILQAIPKLDGAQMGTLMLNLLRLDPAKLRSAKQAWRSSGCACRRRQVCGRRGRAKQNRAKWFNLFRDELRNIGCSLTPWCCSTRESTWRTGCAGPWWCPPCCSNGPVEIIDFAEDHFREKESPSRISW